MPRPRPSATIPTELPPFLHQSEAGLLAAAADGDISAVQRFLGDVRPDKPRDGEGLTALHRATINGHLDVVRLLLAANAHPSPKDNEGRGPLHWAARRGYLEIVQAFVTIGVSVGLLDDRQRTPLHTAADGGHLEVAAYLLRQGAAVDARAEHQHTPLIRAAAAGYESVVWLLLKNGADVEARTGEGFSALHSAVTAGHDAVVDALLEGKADIDGVDATGKTALIWAAQEGVVKTVKLLLERGANVMARDRSGFTALHGTAGEGRDAVVELLLQNGARIEAKDKRGYTAISYAAYVGNGGMVRLLLSHGAFVDSRDQLGGTALHLAAAIGEDVAVAALLDGGADIEAIHAEGGTALHFAAAKGNLSTVRLLLDKEANVHALDDGGQTPADVASRERIKAVLRDWASGAGRNRRGGVSGVPDKPLDDQPRKIQAEGPGPTIVLASRGPETQQSLLKTRKWIQEAKEHIKGLNQAPKKANQRVKVAVIDTGVDLANNDLSPYERRIKFLRGNAEDNKDYDGHGTMVVQLLLSLNPNIEVYVYKVADSRGSLSLSLDHIKELAQLIKDVAHKPDSDSSKAGDHQVGGMAKKSIGIDILNLSFGFADPDEPNLEPLRSALQYIHTVDRVLVLAAARNDGGNAGVMWPASEASCAICINSSDGDGNPSYFNPTQRSPKFCTLGEGFELRLTKDQIERAKTTRKDPFEVTSNRTESGTSFATPIAAALVAMILQFADSNAEAEGLTKQEKHRLRKLRTHPGMMQVFKEKCVQSSLATRGDFYYLAPWFFSLKRTNIYGLLDTLERA